MGTVAINKYKGYQILYDTDHKQFLAESPNPEDSDLGADNETALKEKIDRAIKRGETAAGKFPIEVFYEDYNGNIFHGKITSFTGEKEIWFSWTNKNGENRREKKKLHFQYGSESFFEPTLKNSMLFDAIKTHQNTIDQLETKIKEITQSFENPIDLIKKFNIED